MSASNLSFAIYTKLTHGAYYLLLKTASEEIKNLYLPKMVEGRWTGTMCLTEPQCGTDLGLLRTKAVPQPDGTYRLTGNKIFISGASRISARTSSIWSWRAHPTPARREGDQPVPGTEVPGQPDGSPGLATASSHGHRAQDGDQSVEHLQHRLEDATGYLSATFIKRLRAMFVMMNSARLEVGLQGSRSAKWPIKCRGLCQERLHVVP